VHNREGCKATEVAQIMTPEMALILPLAFFKATASYQRIILHEKACYTDPNQDPN
jgi:hypothetical protein